MSERREVILVCDGCGKEGGDVETCVFAGHEGEVCDTCHGLLTADAVQQFLKNARSTAAIQVKPGPGQRRQKPVALADTVQGMELLRWPDSPWRVTFHALERMGQRKIPMARVLLVLQNPETTSPGREPDVSVWRGQGITLAVNPEQRAVLTVGYWEHD